MSRRTIAFIFIVALASYACAIAAKAAPAVSAHSAAVIDAGSGRVLWQQDGDDRRLIASTTKIMTALVVLENCELGETVRVPAEAVGVEGSSMYLKEGELLTVEELLWGLLLQSGNDAAVALAMHCGGTTESFVAMMNSRARQLGLCDTSFANPNGLDDEAHYSTARELGLIACAAMENPDFRRIVSSRSHSCAGRTLVNHNKLLSYRQDAVGVKTGFTKKAGRTLVGAFEREGRTLVTVTLNAPDDWNDHMAMCDWACESFSRSYEIRAGQELGGIRVYSGENGNVPLEAAEDFSYPLCDGERVELRCALPGFIYAPVTAGQSVGTAELYLGGKRIGAVELVASRSVPEPEEKGFFQSLLDRLGVKMPESG